MVNLTTQEKFSCRTCGSHRLYEVTEFDVLKKITSDCRPVQTLMTLWECSECGLVQKRITADAKVELDSIYQKYITYKDDIEPTVFTSDASDTRSTLIVNQISKMVDLNEAGTLVDIGCGDGAFLSEFSHQKPNWTIYGYDINQNRKDEIERICGRGHFLSGSLNDLPEDVDLVSLNYVIEHIDDVEKLLKLVSAKLSHRGQITALVPDLEKNPYDLVVADHLSHYSKTSYLMQFQALMEVDQCIHFLEKELLVTTRPGSRPKVSPIKYPLSVEGLAKTSIDHLLAVRKIAQRLVGEYESFGILGTAIAGSWLSCELPGAEIFFIDEDERKQQSRHLERPVLAPSATPLGACIFLPFRRKTAENIRQRLSKKTRATMIDPGID